MSKQLITIDIAGGVKTLRQKPTEGIDLRCLGKIEVKRVSEIVFLEDYQKWSVYLLKEGTPCYLSKGHLLMESISICTVSPDSVQQTASGILLFDEYEEAVEAEKRYFNHLDIRDSKKVFSLENKKDRSNSEE